MRKLGQKSKFLIHAKKKMPQHPEFYASMNRFLSKEKPTFLVFHFIVDINTKSSSNIYICAKRFILCCPCTYRTYGQGIYIKLQDKCLHSPESNPPCRNQILQTLWVTQL